MADPRRRARIARLTLATLVVGAGMAGVLIAAPTGAGAATAPPTPESLTSCFGTLTKDASGGSLEPNLLDYSFWCNTPITAYTVIADRQPADRGNIDNYSPTANVVLQSGAGAISATETFACEGTSPSNGVNCNAGAGGQMDAYDAAQGSVDLVDPYCRYLPAHAKPGTAAVPQAIVSVVVSDNTGAEDGPFYLPLTGKCKKVPATVPAPQKVGKKSGKSSSARR